MSVARQHRFTRWFISSALVVFAITWWPAAQASPNPNPSSSPNSSLATNRHWAFQPIATSPLPKTTNKRWPRTPIDSFVLAALEQHHLSPALECNRRTWIRRVTFDLTGLPPTPEEIDAFLTDSSALAYEKVVERLLASPRYGERWGRHWLDVVRYADTAGDSADYPIPQAYLYRDYVIQSFNADRPYDQFLEEQIAGDLLPFETQPQRNEQIVATGYIAIARRFGVSGKEPHLTIEDTIETLGRSVMGLTLSCARCHDHKYDPITMDDYYGLYGIFASTRYPHPGSENEKRQADFVPLMEPNLADERIRVHGERLAELDAAIATIEPKLADIRPEEARTHPTQIKYQRLWEERDALNKNPFGMDSAYAVFDAGATNVAIQRRGDSNQRGPVVERHFLNILGGDRLGPAATGSGRLELAHWLTRPSNPLTARVMVNRIWQYHFGRGLVESANDFGTRGAKPTHPELLDWLADRFVQSGWSVKSMHRLIVLSSTYRLASAPRASEDVQRDPEDHWLARFPRERLDAEELRDALLAVGGNLDLSPVGPHPFPAETSWMFTQHAPFTGSYPSTHRTIYLLQQRIRKDPFLELFDGPDPNASTGQRRVTVTPLQALYAMNASFAHEQAAAFAGRLLQKTESDPDRIARAYALAFGRLPTNGEIDEAQNYLRHVRALMRSNAKSSASESFELSTWSSYARVLLGSNEFLFLD